MYAPIDMKRLQRKEWLHEFDQIQEEGHARARLADGCSFYELMISNLVVQCYILLLIQLHGEIQFFYY